MSTWLSMLVAFAGTALAFTAGACADAPPNIILFLVDDLGQQDVSVPMLEARSALNDRYRTPNLERLAARLGDQDERPLRDLLFAAVAESRGPDDGVRRSTEQSPVGLRPVG